MKDIGKQLSSLPLVPARRQMMREINFQWIDGMASTLNTCFGIDALSGLSEDDRAFAALMFNRRHLVIHNAGRVDQTYLDRTGDRSVRSHEQVVVTDDQLRRLVAIVRGIGRNIISGFESIGPPAKLS
jgi:predicted PilT family ATPase